jgi:hypothetical protein
MREFFCDYDDGFVFLTGFTVVYCTVKNSCSKASCPYKKGQVVTDDE